MRVDVDWPFAGGWIEELENVAELFAGRPVTDAEMYAWKPSLLAKVIGIATVLDRCTVKHAGGADTE